MNGSASEYWPENGATSGAAHLPLTRRDTQMVQKVNPGVLFTKYTARPSGANAGCVSKPPVEITPGANRAGWSSGAVTPRLEATRDRTHRMGTSSLVMTPE